ncbi:MAG: hypothetical protein WCO68_02975 [Verrucomicrobiota bacterium]
MKLERISEYLMITVVTILGATLAVVFGQLASRNPFQTVSIILGGGAALSIALFMRARIWLLIPLFWPMTGQLAGMGSLPVRNLVIGYVFAVFLALKALKVVRSKPEYRLLDYLLLANLAYIATLYIRNPVGVAAFGTELAGGRPYFDILCAAIAYWIIGHMTVSPVLARKFPLLVLAGDFLQGFFNFITFHFPSTALYISKIYTGISPETFNDPTADTETIREGYLGSIGGNIMRVLFAYFPPVSLLNPFCIGRFFCFFISIVFVLKSGFRGVFVSSIFIFFLSAYFRRGVRDIALLLIFGGSILVCIISFQGTLFDLPIPMQRTLSFLPGNWDQKAIVSAQGSSEWRFEMWDIVMRSNKYISNWWLGDGFAISRTQLREAENYADTPGKDEFRESLMIAGDFHSGALTTIKVAGYIGLSLMIALMGAGATLGWRLIYRCRGTPFFAIALFEGCYAVYFPFRYFFIFGSYKVDFPVLVYYIAILTLVDRSLKLWLARRPDARADATSENFNQLADNRPEGSSSSRSSHFCHPTP